MFPNQFNVYLHDTPADSLFARASRSFSHGCVRLENPIALAEYVLRDQPEWTQERIEEAMHAERGAHREAARRRFPSIWVTGPRGCRPTACCSSGGMSTASTVGSDERCSADRLSRLRQDRGRAASAANHAGKSAGGRYAPSSIE